MLCSCQRLESKEEIIQKVAEKVPFKLPSDNWEIYQFSPEVGMYLFYYDTKNRKYIMEVAKDAKSNEYRANVVFIDSLYDNIEYVEFNTNREDAIMYYKRDRKTNERHQQRKQINLH